MAAILVTGSAAAEDRPGSEPHWKEFERQLLAAGIAPNTPSLVVAARFHASSEVRVKAIELLGFRGDKSCIPDLTALALSGEPPLIRDAAALAIMRLGDPEGIALTKRLLREAADIGRKLALATRLAEFRDVTGYDLILRASQSEDRRDRRLSAGGLTALLTDFPEGSRSRLALLGRLRALLEDPAVEVRLEALVQLLSLQSPAPAANLRTTVEAIREHDGDSLNRKAAENLLVLWTTVNPPR